MIAKIYVPLIAVLAIEAVFFMTVTTYAGNVSGKASKTVEDDKEKAPKTIEDNKEKAPKTTEVDKVTTSNAAGNDNGKAPKADETAEDYFEYDFPDNWEIEYDGNILDILHVSKQTEIPSESEIPDELRPLTPDGQATVVDLANESDGKMFYTFKTPAGNVFYLIIDRQRNTDNVYFLSAVTEEDLLALSENANSKGSISISSIPSPSAIKPEPDGEVEDPDSIDMDNVDPPIQGNNNGMLIFLLIGLVAVGGAGYYFKIVRPKKQACLDDDDDINEEGDDGEEMEFEDEPEGSD